MIELLLFIIGIVIAWKFSSFFTSAAVGVEEVANSWSEDIVADCAIERVERLEEFTERLNGRQIVTHKQFMNSLGHKVD